MNRLLSTVALFFLMQLFLFGQVNIDTIKTVAKNFYCAKVQAFKSIQQKDISIKDCIPIYHQHATPLYYIINMEPNGFVIVANHYSSVPILAYSFENFYDQNKQNPAFEWWMKHRSDELQSLMNKNLSTNLLWHQYMNKQNIKSTITIAPLVITKWDQGKYYNSACPADPNGPDGHCVTGCVATAVSQLMYYHRWPTSGIGYHGYNHPNYGFIEALFDTCYYDYNEMTPVLTNYNHAASQLLYTTGISFDMVYGPNGSGVWNHSVANSMKSFFKYCPETRYLFRDSTTLDWDSLVLSNLNARKPLYYAGWEDTTYTMGHAFVCDGYQDSGYYHFNWGWGGYLDGYFYSNQLNPGGSNFNISQELIVDIYPDTLTYTYPLYCHQDTIHYPSGTITTGNGNQYYLSNSHCTWLINPECGSSVQLQFNRFNLAQGDTLFVYDGYDEQSNLLQFYTSQNIPILTDQPSPTTLKSTSNSVFLKFISDSISQDLGFNISYASKYCNIDTLTASSGIISDGSGDCDYNNNTNCRWIISPPNAQALSLNFTQFELPPNTTNDFILIYKNSISTSNKIALLDATNPPTEPIYIPAGKAIIKFVTNSSVTAPGWSAFYEDVTSIAPNTIHSLNLFPNPINTQTILSATEPITYVILTDISGKKLTEKQLTPTNELNFNQICPHLSSGIYFCSTNLGVIKIICTSDF
ncbi:MAG TPA: C10 family peptidase [Bacteroidales bacterium]|nr:C10 family peptidase [Bacteroidales bacterium]